MLTNRIAYKGIARASSNEDVANGWLDEMINLRHRGGKLQAIGHKTKKWNVPGDETGTALTWEKIWYHDQDNISNFIGLTDTHELRLINMELSTSELIKSYSADVEVEVGFVKRFMIVVHEGGLDRYLYKDDVYSLIDVPSSLSVTLNTINTRGGSAPQFQETEAASTAEAILGKYYKKLNTISNEDGLLTGGIMYRAALRMYDGSYVLHTIPSYLKLGLKMLMTEKRVEGGGQENDLRTVKFWASGLELELQTALFSGIDTDIYTHLVIFACKNETLYQFDDETFDETILEEKVTSLNNMGEYYEVNFKDIFDNVNDDFKEMANSESWYKIHEVDISEIKESSDATFKEKIDTAGFYQDYATREVLPVDQFSYHDLIAKDAFNYNSRLILADIKTKFGDYLLKIDYLPGLPIGSDYTFEELRKCYLLFTLKTDAGEIQKLSEYFYFAFNLKNGEPSTKKYFRMPRTFGYPDTRCTSIDLIAEEGGINYKIKSFSLEKSDSGNYAYHHSDSWSNDPNNSTANYNNEIFSATFSADKQVNIELFTSSELADGNRIQISELNNPFFFPAENSYQVGTGRIITTASNTEPLSTGQYGEYPLIIFTTKGIWTLFQGTGNVLFSSIKPLNGEVPANKEQITSVGVGVTYTTNLGLFLIQGREVTELTQLLQGSPNIDIQLDANFQLRLNHLQLIQKAEFLSDIDALGYIEDAKIAFDKKNNELIVTNPNKLYSYLYSFDSGVWGKISQSFDILVNAYPVTYAIVSNGGVYSISDENFLTEVETVLTTRPYKLDDSNNFILLHRALQRCEIETKQSTFAGFYVFGSNDLITWQLISGNDRKSGRVTDILTTRAHTKVKYFVFVFASSVHKGDSINSLEVQFYHKLTNKLR